MFELFGSEFGACLNLNSKEENKRKRIRNSGIKEKLKKAQPPPLLDLSARSTQLAARAHTRVR
jgi:hypothetical protein